MCAVFVLRGVFEDGDHRLTPMSTSQCLLSITTLFWQEDLGINPVIIPSAVLGLRSKIVLRQLKNRFPGGNPGPTAGGWYVNISYLRHMCLCVYMCVFSTPYCYCHLSFKIWLHIDWPQF